MLTWTERLILYNQYEILKRLDDDNEDHYKEQQEIVSNGYEICYGELNPSIYEKTMPEKDCEEVIQILEMFRAIVRSMEKHKYTPKSHWATFEGFDGNNEGPQYGFLQFLIDVQGKWEEQKKSPRNSHSQKLMLYRRMLSRWRALGDDRFKLTPEQIEQIAEEK